MSPGYPVETVIEGKASLLVPRLDPEAEEHIQKQRSQAPVFYNKVMKTNRDTAVLALRAYQSKKSRNVQVCEPMTGSGVRGIRLILEAGKIDDIVLGDLSPSALALARENAKLNGVRDRIKFRELDANLLMALHSYPFGRFDYIDVDPYGSPTPYYDTAIRATKNHGMVAITATDMPPLCGVNSRACIRKYGGRPLQGEFCHETALRLLVSSFIRQAAIHGYASTPLFTYYADHYVRAYFKVDKGARRIEGLINQLGFIKYCPSCLHRFPSVENAPERCGCGEEMNIGGPLWLGELSDDEFLGVMIKEIGNAPHLVGTKAETIMNLAKGEIGFPVAFFDFDKICKLVGVKSVSTEDAFSALKDAGFNAVPTHYRSRALKTNASIEELVEVFNGFKKNG
jgi:tRNA (guanine26-N2/guanine27-N2)-dimethyltransferase